MSDKFGKKWFIVLPALIGVVDAVIAGSSKHATILIAGQALAGLANAGCVSPRASTTSQIIFAMQILIQVCYFQIIGVPTALEVAPNKYRPWTKGIVMTLANVAVIAGTLAAGFFVK